MKPEEVKKIAVIGAGLMGSQLTEVFTRIGGYQVCMVDVNDELVKKGIQIMADRLERFFVAKGRMTSEEKKSILDRVKGSAKLEEAVRDADFVIEAVAENLPLKQEIFKKLNASAPAGTILASNTSYQNISEMAAVTNKPDKVVGMHFFNPVAMMKLVEVVRGVLTSDGTVEFISGLARKLGKEPVVCRDSSYGFLANRAYGGLNREAVEMVWERVAPPAEIDKALKLGYNLPMGPLELGDMTGGWGLRASSEAESIKELGPEKGRLHPLVRMMVRAGYPGGQGKKGIYAFWNEVLSKW